MQPNVLIVDDDLGTLQILQQYLDDMADVGIVSGGREALQYVQHHHVDIIFLDINMPMMNGFKTLEQFRNLKESINVPVVFITGRSDKATVMNSALMGVDGYLRKPIDRDTIREKVMEIWQNQEKKENRKTILAIDDDMAYLKLINSYLSETYNVVMINSAKLAMNYLAKHTPDLVLLDYKMPLYNGGNILNMMQKNSETQPIPVILLSGAIDREVLMECLPYKPVAYLAKPVTKEILYENIEKVFQ